MENKSTYILSLEGKDLILAGEEGYKVKKGKKFKATFDYCLDAIQLSNKENELSEDNKIFYTVNDKQFTKAIINITFEYAVKEFNIFYLDKNKVYIKHGVDTSNLVFENGVAMINDEVAAIIVDKYINTTEGELLEIIKDELLDVVGFTFKFNKKNQIKWEADTSKLKTLFSSDYIRNYLYENGFMCDGVKMVRYKRSSGSSRVGKCLFIREDLYDYMMDWSYMDLKFPEDKVCDLAAIEAYISLTTSSIIDTIEIRPEQILVIDDYDSIFYDKVMETKIVDGRFVTDVNENAKISNSIWDGQSLLEATAIFGKAPDENISWVNGKYYDKGFLLLRNRMFKSACFATFIQKFFADNNITDISQLNGFTLAKDIKDIVMITTKSSIKYTKFSTLENYLAKIDSTFGIVKYDKPTHFFDGDLVQVHYQLINTLQLSKPEIAQFIKPSIEYVNLLKKDIRVFRHYLGIRIEDSIKIGDINKTDEMMFTMLQTNNEFLNNDVFKNFRDDVIESYVKNMRRGHILCKGNYSVLFGNGLSMLKASIGQFDGTSEIGKDEIICGNFPLGTKLIGCRSPHITMGDLWVCTTTENLDVNKYFSLSNQIVYVSSIKNNLLQRLQGADFDSDAIALIDEKILLDSCQKNYDRFLVPTFDEESKKAASKTNRKNTSKDKADLDIKTANDMIGTIVNQSQILNSILWDLVNSNEDILSSKIQEIYKDICTLSVASGIAIDSAKKEFPINLQNELDIISAKYRMFNKDEWKAERPLFFKEVGDERGKKNYYFKPMKTAMDYLQEEITKGMKTTRNKNRRGQTNIIIPLARLINKNNSINANLADRKQIDNFIIPTINKFKTDSDIIWKNEEKSSEEKYNEYKELKDRLYFELDEKFISEHTIKKIVLDVAKGKYPKIERTLLSAMYNAKWYVFKSLFTKNMDNVVCLERSNDETFDVKLYGIYFKSCTKNV